MNVIEFENIGKLYRLGQIGTGTISHDLNRWWCQIRGKEDPFLKIGQKNDRTQKASAGDYVWALQHITFNITQGDVVGIIGRNGSGKSTLLKILSRVTIPSTGIIRSRGRIASLLEVGTGFHPEMSGRENIFMNGSIMGMTKREIARKFDEIVDFAGVAKYIDTPIKRYSSGMTVRLGFAIAAFLEPEILVVDEVLAVGDAEFQKKAIGKMQDVATDEGRTVLFVSHNMAAVKNLCKTGVLLNNGYVEKTGEINDIIEAYTSVYASEVNDVNFVMINDSFRTKYSAREVEFVSIERVNPYEIANNEDIVINIEIKKINSAFDVPIRVLGLFNNTFGERIGAFMTPEIDSANLHDSSMNIVVQNHNLACGDYFLDFALISGGVVDGYLTRDALRKTISVRVSKDSIYTGEYITQWQKSWGSICNYSVKVSF